MATPTGQRPPLPGDLIYLRDADTGQVFTDRVFVVLPEDLPLLVADRDGEWTVPVQCDGRCEGRDGCTGGPREHTFTLTVDDFMLATDVTAVR
jgi:hypothetical protein